jgi:23S rRNA pseudouridine2605 synthase
MYNKNNNKNKTKNQSDKNNKFSNNKKTDKKSYKGKKDNFKFSSRTKRTNKTNDVEKPSDGTVRLNKYIANAGICSRREADKLIEAGVVKVNGETITTLGYKIKPTDIVEVEGQKIRNEKKVYILLNKPKDYLTTTKDPKNRKTVMELIKGAVKERVFPVGRLDRKTTGLLLFTNDGELADKLMHPKSNVPKLYHVTLNKNFSGSDFEKLVKGIELEDGFIKPDALSYVMGKKNELGIQIHSGKNRIIRRIFEHLGYDVIKLDRVMYAGLTKKNLPRGKWRFLTEKEVNFLKMLC